MTDIEDLSDDVLDTLIPINDTFTLSSLSDHALTLLELATGKPTQLYAQKRSAYYALQPPPTLPWKDCLVSQDPRDRKYVDDANDLYERCHTEYNQKKLKWEQNFPDIVRERKRRRRYKKDKWERENQVIVYERIRIRARARMKKREVYYEKIRDQIRQLSEI
jgi:hypothetical protein